MLDYSQLARLRLCGLKPSCCPTIEEMKTLTSLARNASSDEDWILLRAYWCQLCGNATTTSVET